MSDIVNKAMENHKKGYNCAQAVACAFSEKLGKDEKDIFQIMEGFGLGMQTIETCGAVSAMAAVVGMVESDGDLENPKTKKVSYKTVIGLVKEFNDKNGSIFCKDLKVIETGTPLRSCGGCIKDAVEIVEKYLNEK